MVTRWPRLRQHMVVEPAQKLERHILEGQGRPVEQLHQPEPAIDLPAGAPRPCGRSRHRIPAPAGRNPPPRSARRGRAASPAPPASDNRARQCGEIELRPAFRQEQPAVAGKPGQQDLVKGQRRGGAAGAEIAQGGALGVRQGVRECGYPIARGPGRQGGGRARQPPLPRFKREGGAGGKRRPGEAEERLACETLRPPTASPEFVTSPGRSRVRVRRPYSAATP